MTALAPQIRSHALRLHAGEQWAWIAGGLVYSFLVPFVFADRLAIDRDLYYGIYTVSVLALLALWLRSTGVHGSALVRRRWVRGCALGVVFAGVMALIVVRTGGATAHPSGAEFAAAIVWRGVVYGAIDGLLLSVFPIVAVFTAFRDSRLRRTLRGTVAVGAIALVASLAMTASYHVGYSDFRSQKVAKTLFGDVVWSAPTLLTLNPIGAPIAHVGQHIAAVVSSYDGDLFLPPHR